MTSERRTAGLPLSVGSAPLATRLLLAILFAAVGALCVAAGIAIDRSSGSTLATLLAALAVVPLGFVAWLAAAFALAPFSRYGVWLDAFLPTLAGTRAVVVLAAFWLAAAVAIAVARIW